MRESLIISSRNWRYDKSTLISLHSDFEHYIISLSYSVLSLTNCHFNCDCEAVSKYWSHCCSA